jgi:hypothetical protein
MNYTQYTNCCIDCSPLLNWDINYYLAGPSVTDKTAVVEILLGQSVIRIHDNDYA